MVDPPWLVNKVDYPHSSVTKSEKTEAILLNSAASFFKFDHVMKPAVKTINFT